MSDDLLTTFTVNPDSLDQDVDTCLVNMTPQERLFANEYLNNGNNKHAAAKAVGKSVSANKLLKNPFVARLIDLRTYQRSLASAATPDAIVKALWDIASVNILDLIDFEALETGDAEIKGDDVLWLRNLKDLPRSKAAAIKSVRALRTGGFEVKLHDRLVALDKLARINGMFTDKLDINDQRSPIPDKIVIEFVDPVRTLPDGTKEIVTDYVVVDTTKQATNADS